MKVLLLNRFYAPDHSATAQIATDLAAFLAGRGHEVVVACGAVLYGQRAGALPRIERRDGVTIRRVWTPALGGGLFGRLTGYLAAYLLLPLVVLRHADRNTAVIVMTDPPLLGLVVGPAARLRGAASVQWVQDLYPEIATAYGVRLAAGAGGRLLAWARNRSFRRSARVVAIGGTMADYLAGQGVARDRLAVIQNWTGDESIRPQPTRSLELRHEWEIPADAFVLGYSGNLGRAHEAETLLDAAERLRDRADILFLFIGGGHTLDQLRREVGRRGLTQVLFRPYQPRERLHLSLGLPDAHWVSLRMDFEGLVVPSKVFGVCAAGRPVIAVCDPAGELPALLGDQDACHVVRPGDGAAMARAIERLAADRTAGDAMGLRARARLDQRYGKARALAAWEGVLADALADGAAR